MTKGEFLLAYRGAVFLKKVGKTFENRNGNFVSLHRQFEREICAPVREYFFSRGRARIRGKSILRE
jgi:hypothetical protein